MKSAYSVMLALLLGSGVALAAGEQATEQTQPDETAMQKEEFQQLDTNQDGYVSVQEAQGQEDLEQVFSSIDQNQDGLLNEEEYRIYKGEEQPGQEQDQEQEKEEGWLE